MHPDGHRHPDGPTYIILASIAAPALATIGVPLLATHFFVFYYGVLADVTPPVALAAYAAAGIANRADAREPHRVPAVDGQGAVPFMFAYTPSPVRRLRVDAFSRCDCRHRRDRRALGRIPVATTITRLEQVVLTIGGLILVFNHLWLNVAGMTIVGVTLALNVLRARRSPTPG